MFGPASFAPALARAGSALVLIFVLSDGVVGQVGRGEVELPPGPENPVPRFDENTARFNLHTDYYYWDENAVAKHYKRSKYTTANITLAGQAPDKSGHTVMPAKRPFAVGQKSSSPFGSSHGRWDVRENINGYQFLSVFHGFWGRFAVNKLRGHMLRRVANEVKDKLPILDLLVEQSITSGDVGDQLYTIKRQIRRAIMSSLELTDRHINKLMNESNYSGASASMAIVTNRYIITANAGNGRIVAYDTNNEVVVLSSPQDCPFPFGANETKRTGNYAQKDKNRDCKPDVYMKSRFYDSKNGDKVQLAFVLLESSTVARALPPEVPVKLVASEVAKRPNDPTREQELYSSAVKSILNLASSKHNIISPTDFTVALVGLADFSLIH